MKELTDKLREEIDKEIKKYNNKYCSLEVTVNGSKIKVPKIVLRSLERKMRFYETDGIRDIENNYNILNSVDKVPIIIWTWAFYTILKPKHLKNLDKFEKRESKYKLNRGLKFNFNLGQIDNVYLNNFSFIKGFSEKSLEFDILDKYRGKITGAFVYEHNPPKDQDYDTRAQMEMAISSDVATSFDLTFSALPLEKKLLVWEIKRVRGESEKSPEPSYGDSILPKIKQLIFK